MGRVFLLVLSLVVIRTYTHPNNTTLSNQTIAMLSHNIHYFEDNSRGALFLQRFQTGIKVHDVQKTSAIARYLTDLSDDEYEAEKARYEAESPHSTTKDWDSFVKYIIICQTLEAYPIDKKVNIYEDGVHQATGKRTLARPKSDRVHENLNEALRDLHERARDHERGLGAIDEVKEHKPSKKSPMKFEIVQRESFRGIKRLEARLEQSFKQRSKQPVKLRLMKPVKARSGEPEIGRMSQAFVHGALQSPSQVQSRRNSRTPSLVNDREHPQGRTPRVPSKPVITRADPGAELQSQLEAQSHRWQDRSRSHTRATEVPLLSTPPVHQEGSRARSQAHLQYLSGRNSGRCPISPLAPTPPPHSNRNALGDDHDSQRRVRRSVRSDSSSPEGSSLRESSTFLTEANH